MARAPGNAQVLQDYGLFAVAMGRTDAGIAAARRMVLLDPLNRSSHQILGEALLTARRYDEAIVALQDNPALEPLVPTRPALRLGDPDCSS